MNAHATAARPSAPAGSTGARVAATIALILAAVGTTGCGPDFGSVNFTNRTTPPVETVVDFEGISIRVGIAAGVITTPLDENGKAMDEDTIVDLQSLDPRIVGVDPVIEAGSFVIYGVSPGTTSIGVDIDGTHEADIPVTVTFQ
jgi:hypothetical protein